MVLPRFRWRMNRAIWQVEGFPHMHCNLDFEFCTLGELGAGTTIIKVVVWFPFWNYFFPTAPWVPHYEDEWLVFRVLVLQNTVLSNSCKASPPLTQGWLNMVPVIPEEAWGWAGLWVLKEALHCVLIPYHSSNIYLVSLPCGESPSRDSENRLVTAPPSLILLPWECHSSHQGKVWLLAYAICLQTPVSWNSPPKGLCKPPVNSNHYVLLSSNKHRKSI